MKKPLVIITALERELSSQKLPSGVEIIYSGVGKINATLATIQAINSFKPSQVLNFGTAGKINSTLMGLVSINRVIQRDMYAEPLAPRGRVPFCSRPHEYFSAQGQYVCGSGDSFVNAHDPWLIEQSVDIVDMELFAIAAVAHEFKLPWRSFKFITDDANEESGNEWSRNVNVGENLFLRDLEEILEAPLS